MQHSAAQRSTAQQAAASVFCHYQAYWRYSCQFNLPRKAFQDFSHHSILPLMAYPYKGWRKGRVVPKFFNFFCLSFYAYVQLRLAIHVFLDKARVFTVKYHYNFNVMIMSWLSGRSKHQSTHKSAWCLTQSNKEKFQNLQQSPMFAISSNHFTLFGPPGSYSAQ